MLVDFPVADATRLRPDGRYVLAVRGDLNPISEDLLVEVRRWLVQPSRGQRRLGAGDSFFGSFVSIFVNPRIEDSERQVRFVSQPFALPPPAATAARKEKPMKLLRLPGRFEWKILIALFVVASLPLGAAAYLMSVTIGRIEAITDQHQEAIRQSLGGAIEVYKAYFDADEGQLPRARRRNRRGAHRARQRAGRGARPAAGADPDGHARSWTNGRRRAT